MEKRQAAGAVRVLEIQTEVMVAADNAVDDRGLPARIRQDQLT
jgi:hypothetical protein